MKKIHLIAIGGAIMHNLAIALKRREYTVSGSDDAIYDPARSNLENANMLPSIGWDTSNITPDLDVVILGMHAKLDNPELLKAQELNLKIMSFPEFVAEECADKKRIVIAGSHGKTTTTAMLMHILLENGVDFDYLVGSSLDGFDLSVKLTDAPVVLIEGDEYLSSPIDRRSKFLWYNPHLSIITGIAYDHINVFPTFDLYVDTFREYIESHRPETTIFWYDEDEHLVQLFDDASVKNTPYNTPVFETKKGVTYLQDENGKACELKIVGKHNLQNLRAAQLVCQELGITGEQFYNAASSFVGAGRRMEKIYEKNGQVVYRDFAHSPSKLKATTEAVSETYAGNLLAVFELHTFSSLNKSFLPLYKDTMKSANEAVVFFNEAVFEHKRMEVLSAEYIKTCFGEVSVISDIAELETVVNNYFEARGNVLLMSSGKFENASFDFN